MNDVKSIELIRWKNAAALIGMAQGNWIIRGTGIKASSLVNKTSDKQPGQAEKQQISR